MPSDDEDDDRPRRPRRPRDEDDRPRRRRRDADDDGYDHDRPARPPRKKGGTGRLVLIILGVGVLGVGFCCVTPVVLYLVYGPKPVEVLDASRQPSPEGGTASVTVTLRVGASGPGNMVMGDYVFMAKAGDRTHLHRVSLRGDAGAEYRTTFATPELAKEPGPVEFWVEKDDRGGPSRVSRVRTIP